MTETKKGEQKIMVIPVIATPDKFYPVLMDIRKKYKVIEEFHSNNLFEQPQPQLSGIKQLQPQLSIMMSAVIICEQPSPGIDSSLAK